MLPDITDQPRLISLITSEKDMPLKTQGKYLGLVDAKLLRKRHIIKQKKTKVNLTTNNIIGYYGKTLSYQQIQSY